MHRHRTDERLEALVTGREQRREEVAQSRRTVPREVPHEEAVREPVPGRETPAPAPVPRTTVRSELLAALSSGPALRRAILLQEVLGPPKALQ